MLKHALVILTVFTMYSDAFLNETIHIRVKRGKYYSNPPQRFYRRPPMTHPNKGAFSYTPPPGYMMDDEDAQPNYPSRPKVSRKPNDGLGDEDISNIIKYLSKQDLDKIIEIAAEKDRNRDNFIEKRPFKREESKIIRANVQEFPDQSFPQEPVRVYRDKSQEVEQKLNFNGAYRTQEPDAQFSPFRQDERYSYRPNTNSEQFANNYKSQNDQKSYNGPYAPNEDLLNYVEDATQSKVIYVNNNNNNNGYLNTPLQTEESMHNKQISYLNAYIHHEINDMPPGGGPSNLFTDSQMMKEEELPKPLNLRDDFDISYTNNVPTVVKPGYEAKNFGELPLMSNDYKLDTVSSYKVPHYTVTSNNKYGAPSPISSSSLSSSSSSSLNVPLESAPPPSAAKEQSDAHLKATKIWTHRSKGTAYTLHNDGSLSLERPGRPKTKYGP